MNTPISEPKRKRPFAVTLVGAIAIFAFVVYGALGVLDILNTGFLQSYYQTPLLAGSHLNPAGIQFLGGAYSVVSAFAVLIIGWGAFRMRRWAWIAFMAWCIFILANNILRYFAGSPGYLAMALAAFVVLALNQSNVQEAFGITSPAYVEPENEL